MSAHDARQPSSASRATPGVPGLARPPGPPVPLRTDILPAPQRTVPELLRHAARTQGDAALLTLGETRWRHADAQRIATAQAQRLAAAGVQADDRVAILCGNRIEFLEAFLGCAWIGAACVPINTAAMGPQIAYQLVNSGARLLIVEDTLLERLTLAELDAGVLGAIWVIGELPPATSVHGIPCVPFGRADVAGPADPALRAASAAAPQADPAMPATLPHETSAGGAPGDDPCASAAAPRPGDTLAILYTSGTTGPAKGVTCPQAQYYWWGVHTADILGVTADDVLCTTLPLFHINALNTLAQALVTGAQAVFVPRFSASGFWPTMASTGATVVYLLGAMVPILLAQPPGPAERAHGVRRGLGPGVPPAAARDFLARTGVRLLEGYGSTETNFVIAAHADAPIDGRIGHVRPGFQARVVDEHDVELPAGEAGELVLRADEPFAFATGYLGMPDKTVEAWRNLWFHTGDRVERAADGSLRFIDRIKDAIRRRGENISSYEVEQVLLSHPDVATAAVFPVRSELAEDEVMAALIVQPGARCDLTALAQFCAERLPYFAVPRYIDLVEDLPRTANGKIQKFVLRERGITPSAWDRTPGGGRGSKA